MVIREPINGAAVFHLIGSDAPKRKMSRGMSIAIGVSIVAHVAAGIYLYNANFNVPKAIVPEESPPIPLFIEHPQPPKDVKAPPPTPHPTIHQPVLHPELPQLAPLLAPPEPPKVVLPDTPKALPLAPPLPPAKVEAPKQITRPTWLSKPDGDIMDRYYPERAMRLNQTGAATIRCTVAANGSIAGCEVLSETPADFGFGDAAKKLSRYFKMRPQLENGQAVAGGTVDIPIRFQLSGGN